MKRLIITSCCIVLAFASTIAANRLYIEDFSIAAGETKQVALLMENESVFTGFQLDLVLPEGLTIETKNNGDPKVTINTARADDHQTVTNFRDDGRISILMMSLASTEIYGNSGAIVYFNLTASENFCGNHSISLLNIEMTTPEGTAVNPPDASCVVIGPSTGGDSETLLGQLYIEDFSIVAGETKQVALMMENESVFTGFQVDLVLPEGLTIETKNNGDPKVTINTARADDHQTVTNFREDGRVSILLMSLSNSEISGNNGPIIFFNLTACDSFYGAHQIGLINTEMTNPNGIAINPDDTYCTVTGQNNGGQITPVIELNTNMAKLRLGKTIQLSPTDGTEVTWSSSDESIATVNTNGLVTAITDGMVAITATASNGASAWCAVWCYLRGDANEDGTVSIADVTSLIDYLLTKRWPDDIVPPNPPDPEGPETFTVNGVSFTMIPVEGGTFTMGATAEQIDYYQDDELPTHEVSLSSFRIGKTEVTQALWLAVMGNNPSYFTNETMDLPVEQVSWDDCQEFICKLNQMTGQTFRLPTEAEWEYAARGGKQSLGYKYSGSNNVDDVSWYLDNSDYATHSVATKTPNELGLYDMSGNVWEWCQDWFSNYSDATQNNPTGPNTGNTRVLRGGSWTDIPEGSRVSDRRDNYPSDYRGTDGLRLAM